MSNAKVVEGLLKHPGMNRINGFVKRMSNAWLKGASFWLTGCLQGQWRCLRLNFTALWFRRWQA